MVAVLMSDRPIGKGQESSSYVCSWLPEASSRASFRQLELARRRC